MDVKNVKLMGIDISTRKDKKYVAIFSDGTKTHFGQIGYQDYTTHRDTSRRENYIKRHSHEDWSDPKLAGTLSRYILWNKETLTKSIEDYKKRFKM